MHWMTLPLARYADFSGRSNRTEYWMFVLFQIIAALICALLVSILGEEGAGMVVILLFALFFIALIIPNIAVQVRRFHDQDKSGWFVLLNFVPFVGGLIVLVFMLLPGTDGPNRFGDDPRQAGLTGGLVQ